MSKRDDVGAVGFGQRQARQVDYGVIPNPKCTGLRAFIILDPLRWRPFPAAPSATTAALPTSSPGVVSCFQDNV